eukprot:4897179-Alexandrium_andersonii.AAC.1
MVAELVLSLLGLPGREVVVGAHRLTGAPWQPQQAWARGRLGLGVRGRVRVCEVAPVHCACTV